MTTPVYVRHSCNQCTCIASKEDIKIPPEILKIIKREPVFIGAFSRLGDPGHSYYFAFKCPSCNSLVIDSPHGYTSESTFFLAHYGCPRGTEIHGIIQTQLPIEERNIKELEENIYFREEKNIPPFWSMFKVLGVATLFFLLVRIFWSQLF